jgi:hypothetical protein
MSETDPKDEYGDIGAAPGDDDGELYEPTAFMRGGGRGGSGLIWFSCVDASRDRILQLANLREMEPSDISGPFAWLHFSGMDVVLEGTRARQVVHRVFLGRCSIIYEIRPGQKPKKPDAPVIRTIHFRVPPLPGDGEAKKQPKHEPETERAKQ